MKKILVLYSSIDGHTQHICEHIVEQLNVKKSISIDSYALNEFVDQENGDDITEYDLLILGASIRYGKHRPYVTAFINSNQAKLQKIPTAFFSVNLVARKPEKDTADTNAYIPKFFEQVSWEPNIVDVFAGKLDYARYGIIDKLMIKLIMWITKGETSSDKPIIYTDWKRVETFSSNVIALLDNPHHLADTSKNTSEKSSDSDDDNDKQLNKETEADKKSDKNVDVTDTEKNSKKSEPKAKSKTTHKSKNKKSSKKKSSKTK